MLHVVVYGDYFTACLQYKLNNMNIMSRNAGSDNDNTADPTVNTDVNGNEHISKGLNRYSLEWPVAWASDSDGDYVASILPTSYHNFEDIGEYQLCWGNTWDGYSSAGVVGEVALVGMQSCDALVCLPGDRDYCNQQGRDGMGGLLLLLHYIYYVYNGYDVMVHLSLFVRAPVWTSVEMCLRDMFWCMRITCCAGVCREDGTGCLCDDDRSFAITGGVCGSVSPNSSNDYLFGYKHSVLLMGCLGGALFLFIVGVLLARWAYKKEEQHNDTLAKNVSRRQQQRQSTTQGHPNNDSARRNGVEMSGPAFPSSSQVEDVEAGGELDEEEVEVVMDMDMVGDVGAGMGAGAGTGARHGVFQVHKQSPLARTATLHSRSFRREKVREKSPLPWTGTDAARAAKEEEATATIWKEVKQEQEGGEEERALVMRGRRDGSALNVHVVGEEDVLLGDEDGEQ